MPFSSSRSPLRSRFVAALAVPTAIATGITLAPLVSAPVAQAQNSSSLLPGSGLSDGIAPSDPPERTPTRTEYPDVAGLPEGVEVNRVEWLSPRHVFVYIQSKAMPEQEMKVQILLARDWHSQPDAKFPEVWALDGLRARDDESGWMIETGIEQFYADKNVNVIMPVGGQSSFYSDWLREDNGKNYKWETFLTQELVPVLDNEFRSNKTRAVTGISMGGTAAMNLAERHPYLFDFVGSFSGYLDTTSPGMPQAIRAAQMDAGGYNTDAMWGPPGSQAWIDHDPKLGIEQLKDMDVYVSAGNGQQDLGNNPNLAGVGLEVISRMSTETFARYARQANVDIVTKYRPTGIHSWEFWNFEMEQAWPHIANSLKIPDEGRGADCQVKGTIKLQVTDLGDCLTNEYDVAGGRGVAQDFRGGTAYWSAERNEAFGLFGAINARYSEMGGADSWLGFPITGEMKTPKDGGRGRYVHFENGSIYWTKDTGAWAIPKDMFDGWGKHGWENSDIKYPAGPVRDVAGGKLQEFENGYLAQNSKGEVHLVHGAIGAKYGKMDPNVVGLPTAGEHKIRGGYFQQFENGNIYFSGKTGAHFIRYGAIFDEWRKDGYEQGRKFGWPTEDFAAIPADGNVQQFEHGRLREINGTVRED